MFIKASYKQQEGHRMYNVNSDQVVYVEQDGDYHNVYLEKLPFFINFHGNGAVVGERFPNLIKAHRSYFINPEMIFSLSHQPGNMVEIKFKDGKEITFSRSKTMHADFLEHLEKHGK